MTEGFTPQTLEDTLNRWASATPEQRDAALRNAGIGQRGLRAWWRRYKFSREVARKVAR